MKTTIKIFSVLLTLMLTLTVFTACINNNPAPENKPALENVNVMVLNGTTGFGMAKLISDNKNTHIVISKFLVCCINAFGYNIGFL